MIEMCKHYTTTEHPNFKPKCKKGNWARLKCHSVRKDCKDYEQTKGLNMNPYILYRRGKDTLGTIYT